jgi:hypothetical protein
MPRFKQDQHWLLTGSGWVRQTVQTHACEGFKNEQQHLPK